MGFELVFWMSFVTLRRSFFGIFSVCGFVMLVQLHLSFCSTTVLFSWNGPADIFLFFWHKSCYLRWSCSWIFLCISTNFPERCSWDLCGSHHQKFSTSLSKLGHDWLALWIHSMSFWVLCPSDKVQLSPPTAPLIVVFTSPCGSASSKVTTALDELCKSSKSRRLFIQTWITIKWGIGVENYP